MRLRIGFAYNEKPAEEAEPPSGAPPPGPPDLYAEWDDPATIAAVEAALRRAGVVVRLPADADFPQRLRDARPDIVFNLAEGLRGPNREAHVPAICEYYAIPYTGSDVGTLCLALDKRRAKEVFRARRIPTAPFAVCGVDGAAVAAWGGGGEARAAGAGGVRAAVRRVGLPALVKPLHEGSSKGIPERALCRTPEEVERRVAEVVESYGQPALVERFLPGREFTCAVLGTGRAARALPLVEVRFAALPAGAAPIYGYEAKWVWDTTADPLDIFACPAEVEPPLAAAVERTALTVYRALGCRDWGRVDLRLDARGVPHVLEVNPLPGVLPDPRQNSCFPKAARAAGLEYEALILRVLELALERYGMSP